MEDGRKATCAERIKRALSIRGMKQSELCQATKIPKSAISQYISGAFEPKQDRIYLIARALRVSEAWLMGFDVPMERKENPPEQRELSEGEKMFRELEALFMQLPAESQRMYLEVIRATLKKHK